MLHAFLVHETPLPLQQGHMWVCVGEQRVGLGGTPSRQVSPTYPFQRSAMIQQHFCPCSSCFLKFCPKQTNTAASGVFLFYQVMYRHV